MQIDADLNINKGIDLIILNIYTFYEYLYSRLGKTIQPLLMRVTFNAIYRCYLKVSSKALVCWYVFKENHVTCGGMARWISPQGVVLAQSALI